MSKASVRNSEGNHSTHNHDHHHSSGMFGERTELIFSCLAGLFLTIGWTTDHFDIFASFAKVFYIVAYIFGGYFALLEAFDNIRHKRLKIDSLMILAAFGAAFLGEWPEGALLLVLFSLGHALENYALGRARKAIEALAKLAPEKALVKKGSEFIEVKVEELKVGDVIQVKPNERVAADGYVVRGESSVDESAITGESVPVDKLPVPSSISDKEKTMAQHRIYSGTINGSGTMEVQVSRLSSESTLSKVIHMVNESESKKSPTQQFTDRFEKYFVPIVLVTVLILPFAYFFIKETWQESLYRAFAVVVAASPCALAIATPSAVLSAVARAAKRGVLIKGGAPLEELGMLKAIAFDKTGTLTEGRPRVTDVIALSGKSLQDLLFVAVNVEKSSDHPLAAAVVQYGESQKIRSLGSQEVLESVRSIIGKGIQAKLNGEVVEIGKKSLFKNDPDFNDKISQEVSVLEATGRTVMIVKKGNQYLGYLGLMDTPRNSAKEVINKLRSIGIQKMIILSGDNQAVTDAVAKELHLTEAHGDLMPEDKVNFIKQMRTHQKVAMIGDGVNDAPAMTQANVSIAMGAAGSDVALQTADIALMADDLRELSFAVALSRKSKKIIKQNLWLSLGVVAVLVPATIFGLKMGLAVIAHEGSTVIVVFNALRLLGLKENHR